VKIAFRNSWDLLPACKLEIHMKNKQVYTHKEYLKESYANWFRSYSIENGSEYHQIGLTLMPLEVAIFPNVSTSNIKRRLFKKELEVLTKQLVKHLNQQVFKNAFKKHGKKIFSAFTIEGDPNTTKVNYHVHAIFLIPNRIPIMEISNILIECMTDTLHPDAFFPKYNFNNKDKGFSEAYKLDIINEDWSDYILKDVDKKECNNLHM
jgi:hypothetical protein